MAGSACTIDESRASSTQSVKLITFAWTSDDATGAVTSDFTANRYNGQVVRIFTIPDAVAAPTDNYDVTLLNDDGIDMANAGLADRDEATTQVISAAASTNYLADTKLKIAVTNAGNAKKGQVLVFIR